MIQKKEARHNSRKYKQIEKHTREILKILDCPLKNNNWRETPQRVARSLINDFTEPDPFRWTVFEEDHDELILIRHHPVWTRCPHHLERVFMDVSIGYVPNEYVLGVSKLVRLADFHAKGATIQEEYTDTIVEELQKHLDPIGCGCYVIGKHDCMQARGVETTGDIVTSSLRGIFREDVAARNEFFSLVKGG